MKVEQLNNVQIDWTKPQVVLAEDGTRMQVVTNHNPNNDLCFCGVDLETGYFGCGWSKSLFKPENATQYPIELKLTIESDQELCDLWHKLNVSVREANEILSNHLKHKCLYEPTFWKLLDQLVKERNLYKND